MSTAFLAFGSNLGERQSYLDQALSLLANHPKIKLEKTSSMIETDPVGGPQQGRFLNCVCQISTSLDPLELLKATQSIEHQLGRIRTVKDGPRTIDIDILLYDDLQLKTITLTIPHPRMFERTFVTIPLKEIAPDIYQKLTHENISRNPSTEKRNQNS